MALQEGALRDNLFASLPPDAGAWSEQQLQQLFNQ